MREKDEHRTSNVQHRMKRPTSNEKIEKLAADSHQTPLCELRTAGRPTPVPSAGATGQAQTDPSTIFRTYGAGTDI